MKEQADIGIIGGSGLYEMDGFAGHEVVLETPFGKPSDAVVVARVRSVPGSTGRAPGCTAWLAGI